MKVFWRNELNGRSGIVVEPEGYDGTPWIKELWVDRSPIALHPDRVAIAAALVFGREVAGDLNFERPISIGAAESIKEFCNAPSLNVSPIDYEQRPFANGDGKMEILHNAISIPGSTHFLDSRSFSLSVMPSDQYSGSLISSNNLIVSSNAYLHDARSQKYQNASYGSLAIGVLFAEDLGLDICASNGNALPLAASEMLVACGLRTE